MKNIFKELGRQIFKSREGDATSLKDFNDALAMDLRHTPAVHRLLKRGYNHAWNDRVFSLSRIEIDPGTAKQIILPFAMVDLTTKEGLATFDRYLKHLMRNGTPLEENDPAVEMIIYRQGVLGGEKPDGSSPNYRKRNVNEVLQR